MNYYKANGYYFISDNQYDLSPIDKEELTSTDKIYFLKDFGRESRFMFRTDISSLREYSEGINQLFKSNNPQINVINTSYSNWIFHMDRVIEGKWKVNIIALGDVGSTLLGGLKLLGSKVISEIGIFDLNESQLKRLEMEYNQVLDPFDSETMPSVSIINEDQIFDCDMLIFCASKSIPEVGSEIEDVRMYQFKENKKIASHYAKLARENFFKGVFAVVSDPVDLLCRAVFEASNTNMDNEFDFMGLKPEQVIGYGLGVMNARANYYANQLEISDYPLNGRAYGPHGSDLVIINDVNNYDASVSQELTNLAIEANKVVRGFGYKPYIAPALSSAALPILNTIMGKYSYTSIFLGGVYYGCKNKLVGRKIEIDKIDFNEEIHTVIDNSYSNVRRLYNE